MAALFGVPFYAAYAALVAFSDWTPEAVEKLFGLLGLFLMPLCSGAIVYTVHHGAAATLAAALRAALGAWTRLIAAYVFVCFAVLGALAVSVLPPGILIAFLVQTKRASESLFWALVPFGLAGLLWVLPRYVLLDAIIVLEGKGAYQARTESRERVGMRRTLVTGAWALLALPLFVVENAADFLGTWASPKLGIAPGLLTPSIGLLTTLGYLFPEVFFYLVWRDSMPGGEVKG